MIFCIELTIIWAHYIKEHSFEEIKCNMDFLNWSSFGEINFKIKSLINFVGINEIKSQVLKLKNVSMLKIRSKILKLFWSIENFSSNCTLD